MAVRVVTPARVVFEGSARSLVAPAWDGRVGVLPGHAPFMTLLGRGPLELTAEAEDGGADRVGRRSFGLAGGVMKVENNRVDILADAADSE